MMTDFACLVLLQYSQSAVLIEEAAFYSGAKCRAVLRHENARLRIFRT